MRNEITYFLVELCCFPVHCLEEEEPLLPSIPSNPSLSNSGGSGCGGGGGKGVEEVSDLL